MIKLPLHRILFMLSLLLVSCTKKEPIFNEAQWAEDLDQWRENRITELKSDRGWLSLTGMDWLKEGANTLGSDASNEVRFKDGSAPLKVGMIYMMADSFLFVADPAAEVLHEGNSITKIKMEADHTGNQTILRSGTVQFGIIKRTGRYALRTWDDRAETLANFGEIPIFEPDPNWVISATFHRYDPPPKFDFEHSGRNLRR